MTTSTRAMLDLDRFQAARHRLLVLRAKKLQDDMTDDQLDDLHESEEDQLRLLFSMPAGAPYQVFEKIGLLHEVLVANATAGKRIDHWEISFLANIEADLCRLTIGRGGES